jgi:hypothetical protein
MLRDVEQQSEREDREHWRVGDGGGRWDVGLGERLAQTIWRWLGREGEGMRIGPVEGEGERRREAA